LLDADADRAGLELRLIKLLFKRPRACASVAGNGGSWRRAAACSSNSNANRLLFLPDMAVITLKSQPHVT
jgi:hypothetical protein